MSVTKKWKGVNSCDATRREPYQKTRAMTKKIIACESAQRRLLHTAAFFAFSSGASRLSE